MANPSSSENKGLRTRPSPIETENSKVLRSGSSASSPGGQFGGKASPSRVSSVLSRSFSSSPSSKSRRPHSALDFRVSGELGGIRAEPTSCYSPNPYGMQFNSVARSSPSYGFATRTEKRFPKDAQWGQHGNLPVVLKTNSSDAFYNVPSSVGSQPLSTKRSMNALTPGKRSAPRHDHLYGTTVYFGKETERVRRIRQTSTRDVGPVYYGRPPSSLGRQQDSTKRSSPAAGFGAQTDSRFGYFERSIRASVSPPATRYTVRR